MEIIKDSQLDIIHQLIIRDLNFIAEGIFTFLDFSTLMHCELVSKSWNLVIRSGRLWEKIYNKESKKNPLLHVPLLHYEKHEASMHQIENDQFPFKRLFYTKQKVEKNWTLGHFSTTILKIGKVHVFSHVMDEKRIALGLVSPEQLPFIKVVNRWTLKVECILTGSIQENMRNLQLYGDLIFCSYDDGTITVWNITTRQVVQHFQDQFMENRELARESRPQISFHAAHGLFISCLGFVATNGIHFKFMNVDTHITIRRILSPGNMVVENTQVIPYSQVLQFESIPNFFIILFRQYPYEEKLQLRSKVDFQAVREIKIEFCSMFTYRNGRLLTIERSLIFTFWDPETLDSIFTFNAPFGGTFIKPIEEIFLTTRHLITRGDGLDGFVKVYDLFSLDNGKCMHFQELSRFRLKNGEKRVVQACFGRLLGFISTCLDELQIVTIAFSQSTSKLVVRDFTS